MEQAATNKLRNQVKRAPNDDERLVVAVGVDALRRCVPAQALEVLDEERNGAAPAEVAALASAVHGVSILKQLRPALEERGLEPPREWSGRRVTRQWVASLGFPSDWAGFPSSSRAAVEMIDGPAVLNPLHDYQEFVTDRIKGLLRGVGPDRGMVSLPTGAGKTRVTVEALVNAVRENDVSPEVPLIWIAQTDELCEQAAETWTYVWRAIGPRFRCDWAGYGQTTRFRRNPEASNLVIATIDKLSSLTSRSGSEYRLASRDLDRRRGRGARIHCPGVHKGSRMAGSQQPGATQRSEGRSSDSPRHRSGATPEETERLAGRYERTDWTAARSERRTPTRSSRTWACLPRCATSLLASTRRQ